MQRVTPQIFKVFNIKDVPNIHNYLIGDYYNTIALKTDYKPFIYDNEAMNSMRMLINSKYLQNWEYNKNSLMYIWQICHYFKMENSHFLIKCQEGSGAFPFIEIAAQLCKAIVIHPKIRRFADKSEIITELVQFILACISEGKTYIIIISAIAIQSAICYDLLAYWIKCFNRNYLPIEISAALQNMSLEKCLLLIKKKLHFAFINGAIDVCNTIQIEHLSFNETKETISKYFTCKNAPCADLLVNSISPYFVTPIKRDILCIHSLEFDFEVYYNRERVIEFIGGCDTIQETLTKILCSRKIYYSSIIKHHDRLTEICNKFEEALDKIGKSQHELYADTQRIEDVLSELQKRVESLKQSIENKRAIANEIEKEMLAIDNEVSISKYSQLEEILQMISNQQTHKLDAKSKSSIELMKLVETICVQCSCQNICDALHTMDLKVIESNRNTRILLRK